MLVGKSLSNKLAAQDKPMGSTSSHCVGHRLRCGIVPVAAKKRVGGRVVHSGGYVVMCDVHDPPPPPAERSPAQEAFGDNDVGNVSSSRSSGSCTMHANRG